MSKLPECTIEQCDKDENTFFIINKENNGQLEKLDGHFETYENALKYLLDQGWQLMRPKQASPLVVDLRFMKP
jgi:hypothetical protein